MGFKIMDLFVKIKGDTTDVDKKLKGTEKTAKGFGSTMGKVGSFIKSAFVVAAVAGIAKVSKELVLLASDAEETNNKFKVTFGQVASEADAAAKNLADSFGLSRTAAKGLLADTGDLLSGFSFTQDEALALSTQVNELAVDLASFTNYSGGAEGASAALTKGLLGEREALKSLGIAISEADIKQLAEDKGITGELDRQTKAMLTFELATKQSKNAIGDFARSEDSFANQSKIARANVQNLKEALGAGLMPVANVGVRLFNEMSGELVGLADQFQAFSQSAEGSEMIASALGDIAGVISVLKELSGDYFENVFGYLENLIEPLKEFFGEAESGAEIFEVLGIVFNVVGGYMATLGTLVGNLISLWLKYFDVFMSGAKLVIAYAKGIMNPFDREAQQEVINAAGKFKDSFFEAGSQIVDTFVETGKTVKKEVSNFADDAEQAAADYEKAFITANENVSKMTTDQLISGSEANKRRQELETEKLKREEEKRAKIRKDAQEEYLSNLEAYNDRILELTGTDEEKLEDKYQKDLELAMKAGADKQEIEEYYAGERAKLAEEETEAKKQALDDQLSAFSSYAGGAADLASGLVDYIIGQDEHLTEEKRNAALAAYRIQQAAAIAQIGIDTAAAISRQYADLPIYLAIPASIIAGAAAAVQIGTVISTPPPFNSGGIVGGQPSSVDNVTASLTTGEEVITQDDPRHRFNGGGGNPTQIIINLDGRMIAESTINDYVNTGRITVEARAIS